MWAQSASQARIAASSASPSMRCSTRRTVASAGAHLTVRLAHGAAEPGEQAGRGVGGPFRDRRGGRDPGKDRAGSQSQDEDQRVAPAPGPAWIGHGGRTDQEPGMADRQGRGSVGELAQADSDGR
ncbi:hypothetical protein AQJ46_44745 [Streptomyces canus]|uniref:Uncharacterized protein n=1 Tax=Streptomyces canus TaxID=58343 RepID=A0A101RM17_9ACTN|nr:hypothetical protein AQJ46_44745 [Streptomyces canus]